MSFDLAVWREEAPITASAAQEKYLRFCDGMLDGEADPRVAAFVTDVAALFPYLKDDTESSPWSCDPWIGPDHIIMTIQYSRAGEVESAAGHLATEHGLVYYDPQRYSVRNPPALLSRPGPMLTMCDGSALHEPAASALSEALRTLSARNWFAILEVADQVYVQVGLGPKAGIGNAEGAYSLEHRDGSPERHRRHVTTDLDVVIGAFQALAAGEEGWTGRLSWEPVAY